MRLEERARLTQETLDAWHLRPFAWGKADCAQLAADHARRFGHKPRLHKIGPYDSALGAKRALGRCGVSTMAGLLDATPSLIRLPAPAFAIVGDLVAVPGPEIGAIGVFLGNGKTLMWREDVDVAVVIGEIEIWEGAWRV